MKIADSARGLLQTFQARHLSRELVELERSATMLVAPERGLNLYTIELPAGDVGSINVGWYPNGAPRLDPEEWLSQGYDGVRFVGQGVGVTHVRCTSWDGITLAVGRHDGVVQFENMTVHAGHEKGAQFGEQNKARILFPKFQVRLINVDGVCEKPELNRKRYTIKKGEAAAFSGQLTSGGQTQRLEKGAIAPFGGELASDPIRTKWLWFSYNADLYLRKVRSYAAEAVEHSLYAHGFACFGLDIDECEFDGSGSQQVKVRSDASETAWAGPLQWVKIRRTTFRGNLRRWTWRGPGMIVGEGTACHWLIERCFFFGGVRVGEGQEGLALNDLSQAIKLSCEGNSYAHGTGEIGTGFGNGFVLIRWCAVAGASDVTWHNDGVRCARNGGGQYAARGFLLEDSGYFGRNMILSVGNLPPGRMRVQRVNTPQIVDYCRGLGMDVAHEAKFPTSSRLVPLSEGIVR